MRTRERLAHRLIDTTARRALAAALACAWLLAGGAAPLCAAEPPADSFDAAAEGEEWDAADGDAAGGAAAEPVVTDPEQMNLRQLMEMQQYVYVATSGRDPFTFRIREEPAEAPPPEDADDDEEEEVVPPPTTADRPKRPSEEEQDRRMAIWHRRARSGVIGGLYENALETCDEALGEVEEWEGVTSERAMLLYQRLVSLRRTAYRLARREEVRRTFEGLPIKVTGIRWGPDRAFAVIRQDQVAESALVEPGEILAVQTPDGVVELQVETVEEDGVIFIYGDTGQRLRKGLHETEPDLP